MSSKVFPVKLDDNPITFQCKSVTLRDYKDLLRLLDTVRSNGSKVEAADEMLKAVKMVVVGWDSPEPLTEIDAYITPQEAMTIVGSALMGMKLNEDDRKK